jgi:predicted MFS family arabinose efflux permease
MNGLWPVIVFLSLMGIAFAFFLAPNNLIVMRLGSEDKQGVVGGLFKTVTNLGLAFGICIFGTVYSATVQDVHMAKAIAGADRLSASLKIFSGMRNAFFLGGLISLAALYFSMKSKRA